jgi:hypothetical protein
MLRAKALAKPAELARIGGHSFQILKRRRATTMSQVKSARQDQFDAHESSQESSWIEADQNKTIMETRGSAA